MLIITKRNAPEEALDAVKEYLIRHGFDIHQSTGANRTILGVIGDTDALDAAGDRGDARREPGGPDPEGRLSRTTSRATVQPAGPGSSPSSSA